MSEGSDVNVGELTRNNDLEGDFETRKIQSNGRVDVPDKYWNAMDLSEGDNIVVAFDGDRVIVKQKDVDVIDL